MGLNGLIALHHTMIGGVLLKSAGHVWVDGRSNAIIFEHVSTVGGLQLAMMGIFWRQHTLEALLCGRGVERVERIEI